MLGGGLGGVGGGGNGGEVGGDDGLFGGKEEEEDGDGDDVLVCCCSWNGGVDGGENGGGVGGVWCWKKMEKVASQEGLGCCFYGWCVCCWRRKEEMKRRGEDIKGGGYIYKREKLYNIPIPLNETSFHSKAASPSKRPRPIANLRLAIAGRSRKLSVQGK